MPTVSALQILADVRDESTLVVTNQGSARLWPLVSRHPCDFNFNPSTMGGAIPLGLGLALAQPQREVLVISGDGSLLMSLGCLVTVIASGVQNLTIVLLDNEIYEVTGGQAVPGAAAGVDYPGLATAAGFASAAQFATLEAWREGAAAVLQQSGPRFVALRVDAAREAYPKSPAEPIQEQILRLRSELSS